jgi:hypothetical protein
MPPERKSKLKKKPSALKRKHPALQNMKFKKNSTGVGCLVLLDPDPIRISSGSGSETLLLFIGSCHVSL